jgi:hypothetical protein
VLAINRIQRLVSSQTRLRLIEFSHCLDCIAIGCAFSRASSTLLLRLFSDEISLPGYEEQIRLTSFVRLFVAYWPINIYGHQGQHSVWMPFNILTQHVHAL